MLSCLGAFYVILHVVLKEKYARGNVTNALWSVVARMSIKSGFASLCCAGSSCLNNVPHTSNVCPLGNATTHYCLYEIWRGVRIFVTHQLTFITFCHPSAAYGYQTWIQSKLKLNIDSNSVVMYSFACII